MQAVIGQSPQSSRTSVASVGIWCQCRVAGPGEGMVDPDRASPCGTILGLRRLECGSRSPRRAPLAHEAPRMIPIPTSKRTGQRYGWGDGCEGWHLVRSQNLSVIEERMPPGAREVRHWHARARQFFYVVAGTLTLEVEGATHVLAPRSGLELP